MKIRHNYLTLKKKSSFKRAHYSFFSFSNCLSISREGLKTPSNDHIYILLYTFISITKKIDVYIYIKLTARC